MRFDPNFDGHKLMYHPAEVAHWLATGRTPGPIYTEMTLSNRCNCRCLFCGVDYLVNTTGEAIEPAMAKRIIKELAALGNKAIMFSGDGEPLLHPDAAELIAFGAERMSASVTTNGTVLDQAGPELIDGLKWIRFSVNAGDARTYAEVHRTEPELFDRVIDNIGRAVERKRRLGLEVTIGSQLVLIDENAGSALQLAKRMKDLGVDYFSVKPYSQHPLSRNRLEVDSAPFGPLRREIEALADEAFTVIYRAGSMAKVGAAKSYDACHGTQFMCFISANGDVWECNCYVGDPRFHIGNATQESLHDIWTGPRRRTVLDFIRDELDLAGCRDICRMDECNKYLWRLKHPRPHDDFV